MGVLRLCGLWVITSLLQQCGTQANIVYFVVMPKRTTIKIMRDSAISKVPANSVWKEYSTGQVGTAALRDVHHLDADDVSSHEAASQCPICSFERFTSKAHMTRMQWSFSITYGIIPM